MAFGSKALRRFTEHGDASKVSVPHIGRLERILAHLEAATSPEHMDIPGYRFHALRGADKGRYAVNASGNYRVTFAWDRRDAVDVALEDYH